MRDRDLSRDLDLDLGALYGSNVERTRITLDLYRDLYDLPVLVHYDAVTPELLAYCANRDYFVNILAFTGDRVFLRRAFGPSLQWELPGSAVKSLGNETVEDAAFRIIDRDIPGIEIGELRPIAYMEKVYTCAAGRVTHHGVTFMGRARNLRPEDVAREENIKGRFISVQDTVELDRITGLDRQVFLIARPLITEQKSAWAVAIDNEIESTAKITAAARLVHRSLIGPIGRYVSSRRIKAEILHYVQPSHYFLDVACGDDDFIFSVAQKAAFCVGNDVQWQQIRALIASPRRRPGEGKSAKHKYLVFTNHDACLLPFRRKFDLSLCKNLLHHMTTRDQLFGLLASLESVSKAILVVDPEDPQTGRLRARAWHWYYINVLKDQGEKFFTFERFQSLLSEYFRPRAQIRFWRVLTIKGAYMFAHIALDSQDPSQASHV